MGRRGLQKKNPGKGKRQGKNEKKDDLEEILWLQGGKRGVRKFVTQRESPELLVNVWGGQKESWAG